MRPPLRDYVVATLVLSLSTVGLLATLAAPFRAAAAAPAREHHGRALPRSQKEQDRRPSVGPS